MRKPFFALFVTLFALSTSAFAYLVPNAGQLVAEAEYLYFQPLVGNSAYLLQTTGNFQDTPKERHFNTFNGHSGVRVTGKYGLDACSNNFISGSWTSVWRQDRDRTVPLITDLYLVKWNQGIPGPNQFDGSAVSRLKTRYHDGDLILGHHTIEDDGFNLYLLGGLQFLNIHYREDIDLGADGSPFHLSQTCDRRGVGLKTGVDVLFSLPGWMDCWGNLTVHAKATGGLLIARNDSVYRASEANNLMFRMQNERIDTMLAHLEMKLGLNYMAYVFGKCFAAELGYNMIYIPNALDQVTFLDNSELGLSFDHYTDFGLHGLYLGIGMRF